MINSGDTAFVLIAAAMVLLMTPGLAFFYGGMVRRKNILSTLMQCFIIMCVIGLQWELYGYSLAFGPDAGGGLIGTLDWAGLRSVGTNPNPGYSGTIPQLAFMIFQAMFAIITSALIIGAFAERIKFSGMVIFVLLWATLVYDPIAHWVWSVDGWLRNLGGLDFAGGAVVHISSGFSALVMAILIGKRNGYERVALSPHNLPLTVLGGGLLWFGWFGFNAGSALAANGLAANAFVTTNTAAVAAGLTWVLIDWIMNSTPTVLGAMTGAVAGLATITPACGFVSPMSAIIIGMMAGIFCYLFVMKIKPAAGYDDSLDVFGVHGIGGLTGILATGLFAQVAINGAGANGLFFGNAKLFFIQTLCAVSCITYAVVLTFIIYKIVDKLVGLRVSLNDEIIGLDLTQHKEQAYTILD
ncbi:MAG: ammonium transporter [Candidatus Latescibacter sp.]|nr:ammonium transporter [Candidatus Latescibacter sp.]